MKDLLGVLLINDSLILNSNILSVVRKKSSKKNNSVLTFFFSIKANDNCGHIDLVLNTAQF